MLTQTFFTQTFRSIKLFGINSIRFRILEDDWGTSKFIGITAEQKASIPSVKLMQGTEVQLALTKSFLTGSINFLATLNNIAQHFSWTEEQKEFKRQSIEDISKIPHDEIVVSAEIDRDGELVLFSGYHRFFITAERGNKDIKFVVFGGFIKPRFSYKDEKTDYNKTRSLIEPKQA